MEIVRYVHLVPAIAALILGIYLAVEKKGTARHKLAGKVWAYLMLATAITSFSITGGPFDVFYGYSYIHLLSILTIVMVPFGMWSARNRKIIAHRITMISLFVSLCITGVLAMTMQDRVLNSMFF